MPNFDQLNCLYQGSVKDIYQDDQNNLYFKFSDRYSIYDWGEMPDHIPHKGRSLTSMSKSFFSFLDQINIPHHFIEAKADESYIKVQKVEVLRPIKVKGHYDYSAYQKHPTNTLVPLEVIFRLGLPQGSSFFKRANDRAYLQNLGIQNVPAQGEFFEKPIIEFSTKLEPLDRYLSYTQAQHIAGMNQEEFDALIALTQKLAQKLNELFNKMGLELWDGKFEFAFDQDNNGIRNFKLVDSIGLDELRVLKNGIHLSKELLRQYYQKTPWINQLPLYKKQFSDSWKKQMLADEVTPKHLDHEFLELVSSLYSSFAEDLSAVIQEKKGTKLNQWEEKIISYQENQKKNILLIGSGGREHALAWKLLQGRQVEKVFVSAPNHAMLSETGISSFTTPIEQNQNFINELHRQRIEFVVIGPEAPLVEGMADFLRQQGLIVFGPGKEGAKLEESKYFSKNIMLKANIPTADYQMFTSPQKAQEFINNKNWSDGFVIKADGLAAGKGVIVTENKAQALQAVDELMIQNTLGLEDTTIIIEERLIGPEVSVFALMDQYSFKIIGHACDYKRIRDNDQGPNTGGMGTYSPCEWLGQEDEKFIEEQVFAPLLKQLNQEKISYNGVVFAGLMKTKNGIKVLEFNVRFGDPETQSLLPRIENDFADLLYKTASNQLSSIDEIQLKDETVVNVVCAAHGYPGTEGIAVRKNDPITIDSPIIDHGKVFFAGAKKDKNALVTAGGRVLGVTCWGKNKEEARKLAYKNIKNIHFEGMQFRHDIAK